MGKMSVANGLKEIGTKMRIKGRRKPLLGTWGKLLPKCHGRSLVRAPSTGFRLGGEDLTGEVSERSECPLWEALLASCTWVARRDLSVPWALCSESKSAQEISFASMFPSNLESIASFFSLSNHH